MKNKVRIVFWIVLIISAAGLGVIIAALDIPKRYALWITGAYLAVIVIVSVVIDLRWLKDFSNQLTRAADLIYKDNQPDAFLEEIQRLLGEKKSGVLRQIYFVNMGVGYYYKKEYQTALEWLRQVDSKKLQPLQRGVYWMDLELTYFHLGNSGKALAAGEAFNILPDFVKKNTHLTLIRENAGLFELVVKESTSEEDLRQGIVHLEELESLYPNDCYKQDFLHLHKLFAQRLKGA